MGKVGEKGMPLEKEINMQAATYAHFTLAKVRRDAWHSAPSLLQNKWQRKRALVCHQSRETGLSLRPAAQRLKDSGRCLFSPPELASLVPVLKEGVGGNKRTSRTFPERRWRVG